MKTVYQKIILVLILGFFIQMLSFGIFYRHVVMNKVITEINYQENKRQSVMQNIIVEMEQSGKNINDMKSILNKNSEKYNTSFFIKNEQGDIICSVNSQKKCPVCVYEEAYLKADGKILYIIQGNFPPRLTNAKFRTKWDIGRLSVIIVMIITSAIVLIVIYRTIANPLKKLSKAVNRIDYGNTLIEIPYYRKDELGLLCRSFEEMGKRLKKSEENQQELIQAVSHDIKTPLTSIIGYSKRLLEGKVKEEKVYEYHRTIYKRANDLKSLLEEFEEFANIKAENKYNKEILNCKQSFEKLCLDIKTEVESKGCKFSYYNSINPTLVMNFDKKKIERVFDNLIHNSLKYAGDSSSIELKGYGDKNTIIFEIKDSGNGVPKEQLDKIFDKFYRVESSRSREKGGTGLGLSICKDIVESHGGSIKAENLKDGGFIIRITVPIELSS